MAAGHSQLELDMNGHNLPMIIIVLSNLSNVSKPAACPKHRHRRVGSNTTVQTYFILTELAICVIVDQVQARGTVHRRLPRPNAGWVPNEFPKQATPVLDASICYKVIYTAVLCERLARSPVFLHGVAKTLNAFPNPDR